MENAKDVFNIIKDLIEIVFLLLAIADYTNSKKP